MFTLKMSFSNFILGDAIIFHSNVVHTSAPNNSPKRRWALLFTYNLKSNDPVFKHHHPNFTPLSKVSLTCGPHGALVRL